MDIKQAMDTLDVALTDNGITGSVKLDNIG